MKLEIGTYVRTKEGYIAKCTYIDEELEGIYGFDSAIRRSFGDKYDFIYCKEQENYITKASHNIIDLIEVGDYVNGIQVINVKRHLHNDIEIVLTNGLYEWSFSKNESDYNIKSIVTKQQFESMSYKVD